MTGPLPLSPRTRLVTQSLTQSDQCDYTVIDISAHAARAWDGASGAAVSGPRGTATPTGPPRSGSRKHATRRKRRAHARSRAPCRTIHHLAVTGSRPTCRSSFPFVWRCCTTTLQPPSHREEIERGSAKDAAHARYPAVVRQKKFPAPLPRPGRSVRADWVGASMLCRGA